MLNGHMFRSLPLPWVATLILQSALAGVLLAKRLWSRFPLFSCYCLLNFILGLALFAVFNFGLRHLYFQAYWLNEGLGLLLGFAVLYEIFRHLFTPYPALRRLARQIFQGAVALLAVLGCIVAYAQPWGESNHLQASFIVVEQATRILEVGLLLSVFLFASAFGLHWRQYVFGIALGLGVFAAVELVAVTMRLQFGITANPIINICRSVSYNSSLLIWIGYILAPDLATSPAEMPKRAQLEQWNQAVMELIYQ
jgi:hypothetical protein